jgi:transcriptional regulator with XRE-family HTH domain
MGNEKKGNDIKSRRLNTRLKALEVCKLTGIDKSRLSLIENGWVQARPDELRKIESVINLYAKNT